MIMKIEKQAMGEYQTNCYIVYFDDFEILIDTGVNALEWIESRVSNPVAILLTHGHFDHMWDIYKVARRYNIKVFINHRDRVFLEDNPFGQEIEMFQPQYINFLEDNAKLNFQGVDITFHHLPGHSKGSSIIEMLNCYFSGDVIFKNSIGRFDFPYSDKIEMRLSLEHILENFNSDYPIYPGHGENTTLYQERNNLKMWVR